MFDDNQDSNQPAPTVGAATGAAAPAIHGFTGNDMNTPGGVPPASSSSPNDVPSEEVTPPSADQPGAPEPPTAASDDTAASTPAADEPVDLPSPNPSADFQPPEPDHVDESTDDTAATANENDAAPVQDQTADTGDLASIKQSALQQLSPLVDHLDQSPEEKFRTTMMMIQASDDQSLIRTAYDAAQAIPDEKTKAQALLDVINEINYFTHQPSTDEKVND